MSHPDFCPVHDPGHGSRCWSTSTMCRRSCAAAPVPQETPLSPTPGSPQLCSEENTDRFWPDLGGCCSGLIRCDEPRPPSLHHYCPVTDPGHGGLCWSTITMCRRSCAAAKVYPSSLLAAPGHAATT